MDVIDLSKPVSLGVFRAAFVVDSAGVAEAVYIEVFWSV